jgi:hypothetical protein
MRDEFGISERKVFDLFKTLPYRPLTWQSLEGAVDYYWRIRPNQRVIRPSVEPALPSTFRVEASYIIGMLYAGADDSEEYPERIGPASAALAGFVARALTVPLDAATSKCESLPLVLADGLSASAALQYIKELHRATGPLPIAPRYRPFEATQEMIGVTADWAWPGWDVDYYTVLNDQQPH